MTTTDYVMMFSVITCICIYHTTEWKLVKITSTIAILFGMLALIKTFVKGG